MNSLNRTRKRQQKGGELPFFKWFKEEPANKVNEEAELEKEMATIQAAMERLHRKLEGFERKMTMLKGHMMQYEKLTFKTLQLYKSYENGLAALKAQSEGTDLEEQYYDEMENESAGSDEGSETEDVYPMAGDTSEDRPIE
jgi:hypothetical protein